MARFNSAVWKPLGRQTQPRLLKKNKIIIHTMVGTLRGTDSMFRDGGFSGTESHFGTSAAGECWQWQDTDFTADAQLQGNDDAISFENEDWGIDGWKGTGPVPAFTQRQLGKLIEVVTDVCLEHDIPPVELTNSEDASKGIGTHRLGIDPYRTHGERYTAYYGKACPGDARFAQVNGILIPAVARNVRRATKPVARTPHITDALEANATYRRMLRRIDNNRPKVVEVVEKAKRNAWHDFKALQEFDRSDD